jgi:hypothetical protein
MARYFSKARGAGVADPEAGEAVVLARFDEHEAEILSFLLTGHLELLDVDDPLGADPDPLARALGVANWGGGPVEPPQDPALARLFPNAYRDDAEQSGEFRRLTEPDLREAKRTHARTALATLVEHDAGEALRLDLAEARAWLGALNDIRLVLSVRLEISDDDDYVLARIGPDDPRYGVANVYDWLGALLESLVGALPI